MNATIAEQSIATINNKRNYNNSQYSLSAEAQSITKEAFALIYLCATILVQLARIQNNTIKNALQL